MAKGWDAVAEQAEATAEARARNAGSFKPTLKINERNPGPFIVRFLEQGPDVNSFHVHSYRQPPNGRDQGYRQETCLQEIGQECPMCRAGIKRGTRGVFNIIQRNRPVLRKDKDGKAIRNNGEYIIDGHADEVVILNVGGPTAEMLRKTDGHYQGLMSRDFQLSYSGDTFQAINLQLVVDASGNSVATPMSENDRVLAAQKHDLDAFMVPPTLQEAAQIAAKYGSGQVQPSNSATQSSPQGTATQAQPANGFLAGAQVPGGGLPGSGFAAAQQPVAPQPPQQEPGTGQPSVPVVPGPSQAQPPVMQPPAQPVLPQAPQQPAQQQ